MANWSYKKLIRRRKRLHKMAKKKNTADSWRQFRYVRNQCINFIKTAKLDFFNKQINILENPETNVKNWWKLLRNLSGQPSKASNYPPLLVNNEYIEDDNEKSNAFNLFFCEQATVDDSTASFPNTPMSDDIPVLNNIIITEEEVFDHLSLLDVTKATGPDEISGRLLKYNNVCCSRVK